MTPHHSPTFVRAGRFSIIVVMAIVTVQSVTKQYGTQIVLEGVTLDLHAGETAGLVGANGAGKTTLFRLIAGAERPDTGTITRAKGLRIGCLDQEPQISLDRTLHDEVFSVFIAQFYYDAAPHDAVVEETFEYEFNTIERVS